jgi:Na+/H+ antiporter NhaD/arsenite permease-like protein
MIEVIALIIFILGYLLITLESKTKVSKSAFALAMGAVLWVLSSFVLGHEAEEQLIHVGADIFSIVIFLLAAMSLVEVLVHYRFFDVIRGKLFQYHFNDRQQFIIIAIITFFLSAVLDNLTTTIVMIQIARRFFKTENLLIAVTGIVIAANAGGAFSPIGDVTTIMLWLADKFSAWNIIKLGILPSLALLLISTFLLSQKIKPEMSDETTEIVTKLSHSEKIIICITLGSFLLPIIVHTFGLPPYMGLLLGLGIVWILVDVFKIISGTTTHLTASLEELIRKTDIPAIKFFIGILLAVSALGALGVLADISNTIYGTEPASTNVILGNIGLGLLSAVLDNVPLTAIAINILTIESEELWVLLALTVGTGGSLLAIGSAAGVVAVGMVRELTFEKYFKIAFVPALLGYFACVGVWYIQYVIF